MEFSHDQSDEIQKGAEAGLDVSVYSNPEFLAVCMREIRLGLEKNLDVSVYAKTCYDWFQMEEIRLGLESGVDVSVYASEDVSYSVMRELRIALEAGINLSPYKKYSANIIRQLRLSILSRIDIVSYIREGYDAEQVDEIRKAKEKNLSLDGLITRAFRPVAIHEVAEGLSKGIDVRVYSSIDYGWRQMREIRLGLEHRLDVSIYKNPLYDWQQMQEIRLGLECDGDVSSYKSFMYTATQMRARREALGLIPDLSYRKDYRPSDVLESEQLTAREVTEGKDGYYEVLVENGDHTTPTINEDGSVDYKDTGFVKLVRQGDSVIKYHKALKGSNGVGEDGSITEAKTGVDLEMLGGSGFRLLPDGVTYIALIDGRMIYREDRLYIRPITFVDSVGYNDEGLDVAGDLYVRGNISSGARVNATGDLIVEGIIENSYVSAGENIIALKGIVFGGEGIIQAGRDIYARFFQNVHASAGGDIRADYSINSELSAGGGAYFCGKRGLLSGGSLETGDSIRTKQLGNIARNLTLVRVGVTDASLKMERDIFQKKASCEHQLDLLKLHKKKMEKDYTPEQRNVMKLFIKLENSVFTKEQEVRALDGDLQIIKEKRDKARSAHVRVEDELFEGVDITIGKETWHSGSCKRVKVCLISHKIQIRSLD